MTLLPDFQLLRPTRLADAVAALATQDETRPVAGATDLLPNLRRGLGRPRLLVDLTGVPELTEITVAADGETRIGAGVTLARLASDPTIAAALPVVAQAALAVAGPTHRAQATVGGNLCQDTRCVFYNQSEWWRSGNGYCLKYQGDRCHVAPKTSRCFATYRGDLAPALMVLGAEAELAGPQGHRRLPLAELFNEDGAAHLKLAAGEIVSGLVIPAAARGLTAGYEKVRIRDSVDFPLAGVAVALRREGASLGEIRVAITGANSAPCMVDTTVLAGQLWNEEAARRLADRVNKTAKFQNTTSVGMKYRRRVLLGVTRRLVQSLWETST